LCKGNEEILVTRVVPAKSASADARRFLVHPDDRRAFGEDCVSWASSRYLSFNADRFGLIDADTMKLSFPFPAGETPPATLIFNDALTWAAANGDNGVRVAKVTIR
jgi:hypothetical protein